MSGFAGCRINNMQTNGSEYLYRRLQRHLDRMPVGFPATESGVDIRILRDLFTPEQAEIALELSLIPEPARVVYKRLRDRFTFEELEQKLREMDDKGVVLALRADGRETRYAKLIYAVGMYERQVARLTAEMERDGRQYLDEAFGRAFHKKKTPQMRIVPVNKRIAVERAVATYDHIRGYVQQDSTGPFGVIPCICRKGRDLAGEKCRQTEQRDNCLLMGPAAKWAEDSGVGRAISRDEMLALLDKADEDGLVLEVENTKAPMFVCCCCGCW